MDGFTNHKSLLYKPVDYWVDIELNSCAEVLDLGFSRMESLGHLMSQKASLKL